MFADSNFKFDENGGKVSKRVENTVGKREIAHNKQFLLYLQCFQKTCTADTQKQGLVRERVEDTILGTKSRQDRDPLSFFPMYIEGKNIN